MSQKELQIARDAGQQGPTVSRETPPDVPDAPGEADLPAVTTRVLVNPGKRGNHKPFLLTPAVEKIIVAAIESGMHFRQACILAGVHPTTAAEWRRRGEGRDKERRATPALRAFAAAVEKAETMCEFTLVRDVQAIARKESDPAILLKILERRFPERWNPKTVEAKGAVQGAVLIREMVILGPGGQNTVQAVTAGTAPRDPHTLPAAEEVDLPEEPST